MKAHEKHRLEAPKALGIAIIVVSTSRYASASKGMSYVDESGDLAERMVKAAGHTITSRSIVDDDSRMIRSTLLKVLDGADAALIIGGTGLSGRDVTVESVRTLLSKEIEGFSEIFRQLSFQKIGPAAFLSRCVAGLIRQKLVFTIPGSPDAVETALNLILPELPHAVYIARS